MRPWVRLVVECVGGRMDACVGGWVNGCVRACVRGWVGEWMRAWVGWCNEACNLTQMLGVTCYGLAFHPGEKQHS